MQNEPEFGEWEMLMRKEETEVFESGEIGDRRKIEHVDKHRKNGYCLSLTLALPTTDLVNTALLFYSLHSQPPDAGLSYLLWLLLSFPNDH